MPARGTMTALPAARRSRLRAGCSKVVWWSGPLTVPRRGGSEGAGCPSAVYCWRYRSSMMPRPCWAIAASAGACWMEVKAYIWRLRIRAMAASTAATSATGTTTDTVRWSPMTRAAVIEKISTPTAKASPTCTHQRSPCSIGRPVAGERRVRRRAGTSVSRPPHRQHLVGHEMPSGLATKDRWAQDSSLGAVTASV